MGMTYDSSRSYDIVTENGETFHLYGDTCLALLEASTARQADKVFDRLADDIENKNRCDVWLAI